MSVEREELRLNYRCTRCLVNFQYPITVDIWQEGTDLTLIAFDPHPVREVHECTERKLNY